MIPYREALETILGRARDRVTPAEGVSLVQAVGRVTAEELKSPEAVPPFDNSAMDGFAVGAACTLGATRGKPLRLEVVGCVAAGDSAPAEPRAGAAVEIMTGAPMPGAFFDAIIKVEDVKVERDAAGRATAIWVSAPARSGDHVRGRGEDFLPGQHVLPAGVRLTPDHLLSFATLGMDRLPVRRRPRVALISTGRELVDHATETLAPGRIRNSTAPYLMAALGSHGVEARYWGSIPDTTEEFETLVARVLAERPDVILTTGAVSMGKYDFIGESVERLGARILFHKVAIRPGKPLLFAEFPQGGPLLFGVPGNPVSTAVGLRFFVGPYLRALQGMREERPLRAKLGRGTKKPEGLRCFFKARLETRDGVAVAEALAGQASFMVSPLLRANAWVILPEEGAQAAEGTEVEVLPLQPPQDLGFEEALR